MPNDPNHDPTSVPSDSRGWAAAAHLLPLASLGFLAPLIIWLIKRDSDPFAEDQAREALNFQLTLLVYLVGAIALMIAGAFIHISVIIVASIVFFGVAVFAFVGAIVGGVQAAQGRLYRYPAIIRFVSSPLA